MNLRSESHMKVVVVPLGIPVLYEKLFLLKVDLLTLEMLVRLCRL